MAASVTDICNRALQAVGALAITSIDDSSKNARECKRAYDPLRQALLRSHPWNFATIFASLPVVANPANPPPADWQQMFTYNLPSDFLRLVSMTQADVSGWLYDGITFFENQDYYIQNSTIVTWAAAPLRMRYVRDFTNTTLMDPLFRECLAMYMAQEMCEMLTQSNTKTTTMSQKYTLAIREARRANAFDKPPQKPPEDTWVTARHGA